MFKLCTLLYASGLKLHFYGKWFINPGVSVACLVWLSGWGNIVVFRKAVVGDWHFECLSYLQSRVKSVCQMIVFMPLVMVLINRHFYSVISWLNWLQHYDWSIGECIAGCSFYSGVDISCSPILLCLFGLFSNLLGLIVSFGCLIISCFVFS